MSTTMPGTEISPTTTPGAAVPALGPSPGTFDTDGGEDSLQTCEVIMSAAQIFTHLAATNPQHKPDRQIQIRSMVGLTPEQAQLAWEQAAAKAGAGRITERHVKSALDQLQIGASTPAFTQTKAASKPSAKRR